MLSSVNRCQEVGHNSQAADTSTRLAEQQTKDAPRNAEKGMFSIEARHDDVGRVIFIGRPTRKHAEAFLNIPISDSTRRRLDEQIVGSLAMGTSALLEWALAELQCRRITIEARARD
jgi:hypothetical protein